MGDSRQGFLLQIAAFSWISALMLIQLADVTAANAVNKEALPTKPLWNATWTDKLKRDLLLNYDKFARPAQHTNTTNVTIDITIRHIEIEELKSIMTVHGWVKMVWADEKLQWNASDYGGLSVLHLADHEIWQPDIVLYNSASGTSIDHYGNTHCLAYDNGEILWVPPTQFVVFCDLDLRYWPFDTQVCFVKLGSWTYDGFQIDLQLDEKGADIEMLTANAEWNLLSVTESRNVVFYPCCAEPYIDVTYTTTLKRRSPSYSAIVITPATVIVLMTLAVFWLPPTSGEKIILGSCTALMICLFLLYFSQKLPAMAGSTPLVVLFYSNSLYLVCFSLVISVLVLNLSRQSRCLKPLPWPIKHLLVGSVGRALGLGHLISQVSAVSLQRGMMSTAMEDAVVFDEQTTSEEHRMIDSQGRVNQPLNQEHRNNAGNQHDWMLLAAAIDRITFIIYCLMFAILAMVYSV